MWKTDPGDGDLVGEEHHVRFTQVKNTETNSKKCWCQYTHQCDPGCLFSWWFQSNLDSIMASKMRGWDRKIICSRKHRNLRDSYHMQHNYDSTPLGLPRRPHVFTTALRNKCWGLLKAVENGWTLWIKINVKAVCVTGPTFSIDYGSRVKIMRVTITIDKTGLLTIISSKARQIQFNLLKRVYQNYLIDEINERSSISLQDLLNAHIHLSKYQTSTGWKPP